MTTVQNSSKQIFRQILTTGDDFFFFFTGESLLLWFMNLRRWLRVKNALMDFLQTHSFLIHKMLTNGLEWCGQCWGGNTLQPTRVTLSDYLFQVTSKVTHYFLIYKKVSETSLLSPCWEKSQVCAVWMCINSSRNANSEYDAKLQ